MALLVECGQTKTLHVGADTKDLKSKVDALVKSISVFPADIKVENNTKTCQVLVLSRDNTFIIRITNPEDEVFKL